MMVVRLCDQGPAATDQFDIGHDLLKEAKELK
jgi:hypothetical protein